MEIKIRINTNQNQKRFGIEKIYNYKNIREIIDEEDDYVLSGNYKNSVFFSHTISDVKILTLYTDKNKVIDIVISKALIDNLSKESESDINILLNLSSEFVLIEKEEGFLIILKEDYPEELQKSEIFKYK